MDPNQSVDNRRPDGTFGPNNNANPNGRPKGKTIKDLVRDWLEENPGDKKDFVEHFIKRNRELAWQMLEGRPQQDVTSAGEKLPTPIYVQGNDSAEEDKPPQ